MPYASSSVDDMEKLRLAFHEITKTFGSFDNLLEAFGLSGLPQAQRYGIMFGVVVFCCTITAVMALLILGGSFKRIAEQAETGQATNLSAHDARAQRALLLERLLEGRERMVRKYPMPAKSEKRTALTAMLLNESVKPHEIAALVEEDVNKAKALKAKAEYPLHYEENYKNGYRKCQDKPGGAILPGRPEARFEAYARGFAGCGPYTSVAYRRSYGRMYESICCVSHQADDFYDNLFKERPDDIVGRHVRLEALEVDRHLNDVFNITCGDAIFEHSAYEPNKVWGFCDEGPFDTVEELRNSYVFQHKVNEAAFAIVDAVTNRTIGALLLTNDDPTNLTIQMEPPIIPPAFEETQKEIESCFLLMDRLFAFGYRRIQISIDSQDAMRRKLCTRLGFTLEGCLYKHMVVKEANRDSNIYGMLNSDWKNGARGALFRKLYGDKAYRADISNEQKEEEFDEQQRVLDEKKRMEAAAGLVAKKNV